MMEHYMMEQERRNYRLVLRNCQQEHHSLEREQRNLQKELHSLQKELHMTQLEHSSEVLHIRHCSCSCTPYPSPCPCSFSPSGGRFCHRHSYRRIVGHCTQEQLEPHSCLEHHSFEEHHMMGDCNSLGLRMCHRNSPYLCPCSSFPSDGKFSCKRSCRCLPP